jgi:hypothetical protein
MWGTCSSMGRDVDLPGGMKGGKPHSMAYITTPRLQHREAHGGGRGSCARGRNVRGCDFSARYPRTLRRSRGARAEMSAQSFWSLC